MSCVIKTAAVKQMPGRYIINFVSRLEVKMTNLSIAAAAGHQMVEAEAHAETAKVASGPAQANSSMNHFAGAHSGLLLAG